APKDRLRELRDFLGFTRNVIVQASCHGSDNRALVDALLASRGRARGVATVEPDVTDEELEALHAAGVRGIRFNYLRRLAERPPDDVVRGLATRIRRLGWRVVVYFEAPDLPRIYHLLAGLPTVVVVDHMGRPDVSQPTDHPEFRLFLKLLRDHGHVWSKLSGAERLSITGPD